MAFIGKIFGGGKSGQAAKTGDADPIEAIQKLRDCEDLLLKKQAFLEKRIQDEIKIAKANGMTNKKAALQALRKKKRLEKNLEQIDGTLTTIEYQREALENASTNTEILKNMGYAAKALKTAHKDIDIDKVEDLMDEVRDQQSIAEEINNVISNPIGFGQEIDEDELLKELDELDQEELDRQLLDADSGTLPQVPSKKLPDTAAASSSKVSEEEEKELAALKEWGQ